MRRIYFAAFFCALAPFTARAGIIDSFSRSDVSPVNDSLGATEVGSLDYVERGNTAGQAVPIGTAEIINNQLLITGSNQTTTPNASANSGGAYLSGSDIPELRVGADIAFTLVGAAPNGTAGDAGNKFQNTFLLMLRSRAGQNFAAANAAENGLVAIEFNPNADLLIREQRNAVLTTVISRNYFTNAGPVREPIASPNPNALPATYGSGTFDINRNGYLDADEPIHFEALLVGTSLKVFINGLQYGVDYAVTHTAAPSGQLSGIGLHKNRIGGTNAVVNNILVDNLDVTVVPEPTSIALVAAIGCIAAMFITRSRR
jgi:hypothetical protein